MASKVDNLLFKALIEKRLMSEDRLQPYLDEANGSKESLYQVLYKKAVVPEEELLLNLSEILKLPVVDILAAPRQTAVIEKVPLKIAEYYKMAPIKLDKRKLTIAVSCPLDLRTQDDIRAHLGYEIEMVLAREKDISEYLKKFYGFAAGTISEMVAAAPDGSKSTPDQSFERVENIENIEKMAGDASIAKLVNQIIFEAYRKRATDIHIEPYRGKVKLRYRIDGILYNANVQPEMSRFILPILSRIKIMSNLNIVERRLPQDGRAIVKVEETTLDLRVSSIPTPYGESVVIRMLPMNRIFDLTRLGLNERQIDTFEKLINKPHGVIFITGPTGSGKSTTLYACLNKINTDERKIITIEDPVEYEMEGVTQIQVVSNIGLDFAKGLRSMLRHDPDVMMVGEVRDLETAEMAIRVALTGHLVFSTLHTNDAASGVTRLIDIGIQPYLVASSVEAFVAQRLVRVICPKCKEEDKGFAPEIKKQIARELGVPDGALTVYHGKGCNHCNGTGFWSRLAIYEILLITENLKQLIMKRGTASEIRRQALRQGMRTLRQDGWQKVMEGLTTPSEIFEATQEEEGELGVPDDFQARAEQNEVFSYALKNTSRLSKEFKPHTEERRAFMRLDYDRVTVSYRIIKSPRHTEASTAIEERSLTKNISAGGVLFYANETLGTGTILELRFQLPNDDEAVECLARVVREEKAENDLIYEVACCFLDLTVRDRARLEKFVEKESK